MFSLHHLKGNTYYIEAPTNVGVYKLNDRDCILIDTCLPWGDIGKKLISTLTNNNLNVKAILHTHGHIDHFSGNSLVKERFNCIVGAPDIEYIFIEYPELDNMYINTGAPLSPIRDFYAPGSKVDFIYKGDTCTVEGTNFSLLLLRGHTYNHMGIITPDNVIFTGDAYLGQEALSQVKMLFNYDTLKVMETMKFLQTTNYSIYMPSHGKPETNIKDTIDSNIEFINNRMDFILELISEKPMSIDELMAIHIKKFQVSEQVIQHYIAQTCLKTLISALENTGRVKCIFDNSMLKYVKA